MRFPVLRDLLKLTLKKKVSLGHVAAHLRSWQDRNKLIVSLSFASSNRHTAQEKRPRVYFLETLLISHMPASQMPPFPIPSPPCLVHHGGNSKLCSPFLNCLLPINSGSNPSGAQLGKSMPRSQEVKQSSSVQTRATAARGGQEGESRRLWGG